MAPPKKRKAESTSSEEEDNFSSEEEEQTNINSMLPSGRSGGNDDDDESEVETVITKELIQSFMEEQVDINKATVSMFFGHPIPRRSNEPKAKKEKTENASFGYCRLCDAEVKGGLHAMKNHLLSCDKLTSDWTENVDETKDVSVGFMIYPSADKWNRYWLFMEQSFASTLLHVDSTIRDLWVECCYHTSVMKAPDGYEYTNSSGMLSVCEDGGSLFAKAPLFKVIKSSSIGQRFSYTYDMGTPTELTIEIIYVKRRTTELAKPRILARNHSLTHKCSSCKKKATKISQDDYACYCDECLEDEDSALPISNSPRMGCCGYENSELDDYIPASKQPPKKSSKKK